jgi:hypothetical protein
MIHEGFSTLSGCERGFKRLIINYYNDLMYSEGLKFRFVEIDLVSCHSRVLAGLFPAKTPNLTRIFSSNLRLWDEIISCIPAHIVDLIEKEEKTKSLVKIVAYKTLQTGGLKKEKMTQVHDRLNFLEENEHNQVLDALEKNEVLKAFCTLFI